jgi:hypothetical protein
MKVKDDFVTNSSSSSFIFTDKSLTIREAAIEMIDLIVKEYKEHFPGEGKFSWATSAKKKLKKLEPNTNLIVPWSCNYPSFLYRDSEGNVHVDTSWNHEWSSLPSNISSTAEGGDEYNRSQLQNFFNLQTGKLQTRNQHRITEWENFQKRYGKKGDDTYVSSAIEELKKEAVELEEKYANETGLCNK